MSFEERERLEPLLSEASEEISRCIEADVQTDRMKRRKLCVDQELEVAAALETTRLFIAARQSQNLDLDQCRLEVLLNSGHWLVTT